VLILDSPDPNAFHNATDAGRARLLPTHLLVQEHFDVAEALKASLKPKLLLADSPFTFDASRVAANQALFHTVPDPKMTVTFAQPGSNAEYVQAIDRFLGEYLPRR
jgi:hypothetical protein